MKRWFVLSSDPIHALDCYEQIDDRLIPHGLMDADALKRLAAFDPIIVVITGHHWSCFDLTPPQVKPSLLREALPHMVEDRILSDIEDIHCVLPEGYTPGEATTVWVLERTWMQAWCDWAKAYAFNMQTMIPAYTLLPLIEGHVTMMAHNNTLWIRDSVLQGYCLPDEWSQPLLDKWVALDHVDILGDLDDTLKSRFTFTYPHMMRLQDCLVQAQSFPINFLQGDFKQRAARRKLKWSALAVSIGFLGLALLMHMSYLLISNIVLSSRLEELKAQSLALYQKAYPDATVVSSPKALIARALSGESGDQLFFELLDPVSEVIASHPMTIGKLHYQDHTLTLSGSMNDFESVEALTQGLKQKGLSVEQQRAQQENGKIEVSWIIFRGQS